MVGQAPFRRKVSIASGLFDTMLAQSGTPCRKRLLKASMNAQSWGLPGRDMMISRFAQARLLAGRTLAGGGKWSG